MELDRILTKHPRILAFFKHREQAEIDNILLSFIDVLEKCGPTSTTSATTTTTIVVDAPPATSLSTATDNIVINRYVLNEINKEYQEFYRNRDNLIGIFKENEKQTSSLLDIIKMPFLEKYISENCNTTLQSTNQFKCELCNFYTCITKKALSAHQRACKKYVGSL
jgi:hypothetical protein